MTCTFYLFCYSVYLGKHFVKIMDLDYPFGRILWSLLSSYFNDSKCSLSSRLSDLSHLFFDLLLTPFSLLWSSLLLLNSCFVFLYGSSIGSYMFTIQVWNVNLTNYYFVNDFIACLILSFSLSFLLFCVLFDYFLKIYFLALLRLC